MKETLVIGGTGAMGSRVVRRLVETSAAPVGILTRDPESDQALRLAETADGRIRLHRGNVDDIDGVREALRSADRVFCNTDFFSTGSATGEYRQGVAILEAAKAAGIDCFIWSSLDSAVTITDGRIAVPHYDAKAAVASFINLSRSEEMMRKDGDGWYTEHVSILTTAPYFENFQLRLMPQPGPLPDGREGLTFSIPIGAGRYPLIGLDDIAWFAVFMFDAWQSWGARDLAVIGDSLSGAEIAARFEQATGTPAAYTAVPLDALRSGIPEVGHDFAAMFQFFQEHDLLGRSRDMTLLRTIHPGLMNFEAWLVHTGWDGREREVQKFPIRLPDEVRA